MRVLLIGKYPPLQGGVAARYFWLFEALKREYDFNFKVITVAKPPYVASLDNNELSDTVKVLSVKEDTCPWFIPNCDLVTQRIANAALMLIAQERFDIIECNYLVPFLPAAYIVSTIAHIPLVVRPAGSDYHKFIRHKEFAVVIKEQFKHAQSIILPQDRLADFTRLYSPSITNKVKVLPRYIPDPQFFSFTIAKSPDKILLTGKINKFWRLKGIDLLMKTLQDNSNIKLRCIVNGSHLDEFKSFIYSNIDSTRVELIDSFVTPIHMPEEIRNSVAVWNVLMAGGIEDFPNTHSEAVFSGRISITSTYLQSLPDASTIPYELRGLVKDLSQPKLLKADWFWHPSIKSLLCESFQNYLTEHMRFYESVK